MKRALSRNVSSNIAYYAFTVVLNIWFIPYLIHHLGVEAYGLVPLASTVVSYFSVVTLVLNSAVGRYLTIALERGETDKANAIFNTSLFGGLGLLVLLAPPLALLSLHPTAFLNIPAGMEKEASLLLAAVSAAFCVQLGMAPFELATYCKNRFDVRNLVNLVANLSRVGLVVVLFSQGRTTLWSVGLGILLSALLQATGTLAAWKRLLPETRVSLSAFSMESCRRLLGSGWWIAVSQVGTILFLSIDLLLANRELGPEAAGRYATCLQWPALLRGLGMAASGVLGPSVMALYARNDVPGLVDYVRQASRLLGLALALPVGLICAYAAPLLRLWVGEDFVGYAPLLAVMVGHLSFNLALLPVLHVPVATNNLRLPGVMQLLFGGLNLALALALLAGGLDVYALALAGAVVLTLRNVVFAPIYSSLVIGKSWTTFFNEIPPIILLTLAVAGLGLWFNSAFPATSWAAVLFQCACIASLHLLLLYGLFVRQRRLQTLKETSA